jgi:predicted Zn-dependent protease with MMP-like domain
MASNGYLVVFKGLNSIVPRSLREFVKTTIINELSEFNLDLDFSESRNGRDLTVTFSGDVPVWPAFGESTRMDGTEPGESLIYVKGMQTMRIQSGAGSCVTAFLETQDSLGSLIANTTIHEIGHMLGMQDGGYDGGGHTTDPDNYMWNSRSIDLLNDFASSPFEYTVKAGDTLSGIWHRYVNGTLDKCRVGPPGLTYLDVWQNEDNRAKGFVADPTKNGIAGRRANDPNWIYPGEKVSLPNNNLRTPAYRRKLPGFVGQKTFTKGQKDTMKRFIADRLAAGRG